MEAFLFFFAAPLVSAAAQFALSRSGLPRWAKRGPAALAGLTLLVCLLGAVGWIPLPATYAVDRHSFLAFPDYFYLGASCLPVLVGLGIGALIAAAVCEK